MLNIEKDLENYPAILNVEQVANILNVTPKTVRQFIKTENIPVLRIGKRIRIPKASLINYIIEKCVF